MNTLKTKLNKYLSKNCIFIFAVVTFLIMFNRVPFWDEAHAYSIARLNIGEILSLTRVEGHTFLWFFIIKPFSFLNLYPWSMWLINWGFCLGAIWVLWKKAPFCPIIKALITFSTPFVYYFAPVARCYSIGILFLFLICATYKKRFKKPYLFSSLIVACAHTSLMAAVGAFYIGLIYLFDLILKLKKKTFEFKKFKNVFLIFLLGAILFFVQFIGVRKPLNNDILSVIVTIFYTVIFPQAACISAFILHLICSITFYYYTFLTYKKTKRGFFFIFGVYLTLTFIFLFIYQGSQWHYYFYFIYFIVFIWIFKKNILVNKFSKFLFIAILIFYLSPKAVTETGKMELIYSSKSNLIAKEIIQDENLRNSKLYTLEWWDDLAPGASIYLEKENIFIYDLHNRKKTSYESIKNIFDMEYEPIDFDNFYENMDKSGYLLSMGSLFHQNFMNTLVFAQGNGNFIFQTFKRKYYLKMIKKYTDTNLSVFKIIEI